MPTPLRASVFPTLTSITFRTISRASWTATVVGPRRAPKKTRDVFERGLAECADHTGMTLALAVNYGARAEITRAVRQIALDVAAGKIDPAAIDDDMVASHLYTAGLPDPELVIRTSGELRLSNYLLWQVAYSEFYVTDTYWPDFDRWGLVDAILAYQGRDRRFGGLSKTEEA